MKKSYAILFMLAFMFSMVAKAQYVTLTDTAFRSFLKGKYPGCFNATAQLDTTCSTILNLTTLRLADTIMPQYANVTNLHGLQYFKGLLSLYVNDLPITSLSKLPNNITELSVRHCNNMVSLTNFPNKATSLNISRNNSLTSLPPFPPSDPFFQTGPYLLEYNSSLTSLPPLPSRLSILGCSHDNLSSLPALDTSYIDFLYADHNNLTSISKFTVTQIADISYNHITNIPQGSYADWQLHCEYNNLTSLPRLDSLGTFMSELYCQNNQITAIKSLPPFLSILDCSNNPITNFSPHFTENTSASISTLKIHNTQISSLPDFFPANGNPPIQLSRLESYNNNVTCLPVMPPTMTYLMIDSNQNACIPNSVSGMTVYSSTSGLTMPNYPVCNVTNNAYGCQPFPIIKGNVFFDLNSNGVKDAGEFYKAYGRVNLSNGAYTFTDTAGFYRLAASIGPNYTLTTTIPPFFNAVPNNFQFHFFNNDSTIVQNIALQPLITKDSVKISIIPTQNWARPGGSIVYYIIFENAGSSNLGATNIVLHYDPTLLTYSSSSLANVSNSGNTLTLNLSSLPSGKSSTFYSIFSVKTTAVLGTYLYADAALTSGTVTAADSTRNLIVSSFDPNNKTATTAISPAQISNGRYIDYTIRFQNTGNDTAINIVITDTLSNKLQANTFQLVGTSHRGTTTVEGNKVSFEFRNIMLPDSNVNERASHGWVRFKVKPVSGLGLGDSISNKAAIYFDYNSPVITNTTQTHIATQTFPLHLLSFSGSKTATNNITLYWTTANEINTKTFVIEQSNNGRVFSAIGEKRAAGFGNNKYTYNIETVTKGDLYFRLKMIDKDGIFNYSSIVLIKDKINNAGFVLLENPVKKEMVLTSIAASMINTEAILVNNLGVVVRRFVIRSATQTLEVNDLTNGVYYLKTVEGSEKVVVGK